MKSGIVPRALVVPAVLGLAVANAQPLTPTVLTPLSTALNETSGLLVIDGQVWTQLDSGNPNALYQVDPGTGDVLRTVTVANASNVDWEDLTTDGTWVYIGDFGNNSGARTDLRVYRVPLTDLLDPGTMALQADTIMFSYADQIDFTPANNANDRDCEAMIAMDDSLFLFTKNWLSSNTYLYVLPAQPGTQLAVRRDTLDTQGLVTGAARDVFSGSVALCGYTTVLTPFIWQLEGFTGHDVFGGSAERHVVQAPLTQMEGIAWSAPGTLHLTNEQNALAPARLWSLDVDLATALPAEERVEGATAHFDAQAGILTIDTPTAEQLKVIDTAGRVVLQVTLAAGTTRVPTAEWAPGPYVLHMRGLRGDGMLVVAH
ncbi:MAG: hypothetical protein H6595_04775 [Flavobacteriales bacterium]|nr:hypothetical protein [Flavobacteriales bacterium]MCB9166775.1 hypothetical protein [Flavobacteriales bacterium]